MTQWLSVKAYAALVGVSEKTVRLAVRRGRIEGVIIGRAFRVKAPQAISRSYPYHQRRLYTTQIGHTTKSPVKQNR